MKNNTKQNIYFASLQSNFAKEFLQKRNFNPEDLDTIYYFENGEIKSRANAALNVARQLKSPFKYLSLLLLLPEEILNIGYNFVAKNRYKFFGKKDTCRIPNQNELNRFLG